MVPTILSLCAFVTATISGIIGMGGGILLLAIMFCFLPFDQAIPLHAAVQFVTHITRIIAFFKHVDWKTVRRYLLGAIPGCAVAALILASLGEPGRAEPTLKIAIGLYILAATFLPNARSSSERPTGEKTGRDSPRGRPNVHHSYGGKSTDVAITSAGRSSASARIWIAI
ncbi:MAG: sulfite exporter TauE/SafE family protein, partial [Phycisphaerae bacterium]